MELKKINEDKNVLLNNIKELIENFSDTHSKMFTETIEPATENLISMSNDILFIIYFFIIYLFIIYLFIYF